MKSVIETHNLCKSYNGRIVVDHLNLSVPQGLCVWLSGTERCREIYHYEDASWSGAILPVEAFSCLEKPWIRKIV